MKKIGEVLYNLFFFIICLPLYLLEAILINWFTAFDQANGRLSVKGLLEYGRHGFFPGKEVPIVIAKNINEVIWEGKDVLGTNIPASIMKMRVSCWNVRDGKIWIKILINDRFIQELEEELKQKEDSEA